MWNDLADAPPDPMLVTDICALVGQALISHECMLQHGTDKRYIVAFLTMHLEITTKIDLIGGQARIGRSLLWQKFEMLDAFEKDLLPLSEHSS